MNKTEIIQRLRDSTAAVRLTMSEVAQMLEQLADWRLIELDDDPEPAAEPANHAAMIEGAEAEDYEYDDSDDDDNDDEVEAKPKKAKKPATKKKGHR